jgi:hypothetical protein
MASQFAVVTVVFAPKRSLRGFSKFRRCEEFLSLLLIASHPPLCVAIPRFECPR